MNARFTFESNTAVNLDQVVYEDSAKLCFMFQVIVFVVVVHIL